MAEIATHDGLDELAPQQARAPAVSEDWCSVWLGLLIVAAGWLLLQQGGSLRWLAVTPPKWTSFGELAQHFAGNGVRYLAQFIVWAVLLGAAVRLMGYRLGGFTAGFALIYCLSIVIFAAGQWIDANKYNLEPPLVALAVGLLIGNLAGLPAAFRDALRVEFYVKIGIVLLGATLPFSLIMWAGPVAVAQAGLVSIVTFSVIYLVAVRLGLDRRFAAVLGAGGSVCGVSAAIAISSAVGARKQDAPVAITIVIGWAIVMIFALPVVCRAMGLPAGVAGAWIGTSEFADAAGLAAAQAYGDLANGGIVPGTGQQSIAAFTLMKVIGRDAWIGIWALVLALIATTRWEASGHAADVDPWQIWRRFPKFVIGFLVASAVTTLVARGYSLADYNKQVVPAFVQPIKDLRSWAFIFCFLSIGLSTRFKDMAEIGRRPLLAFTSGVAVKRRSWVHSLRRGVCRILEPSAGLRRHGMRGRNRWPAIGMEAAALGLEAWTVIALCVAKLAAGGAEASTEAGRMVDEKVQAAADLQSLALTGALGRTPAAAASKVLKHYRRVVRQNRRRLTTS